MKKNFKTKFIYPILLLFLIFFIFFSLLLLVGESRIIYSLLMGKATWDSVKLFFGFLILFGYFSISFGHITLILRYGLKVQNGRIILINYLSFKKTDISELIKGYSRTDFGQTGASKKTLILYLNDGRKINLPWFMYLNFGEIEPRLLENKVKFLGEEPFRWKNVIQRKYQY